MQNRSDRPRARLPHTCPPPLVTTRGDRRTLEFMPGNVQSEMRLSRPDRLMLAYCRAMMCFALFVPRPRHIVMVGLGGGSLAKFCYRHFPEARISVIELRADVIALRRQFMVPPDDARFRIIQADAASWLAGMAADPAERADVLLLDAYDERGLPPALGSARFYGDCRRALADGGVLVTNILSYDPQYGPMLSRLQLMFDEHVCWLKGVAGNNRILFALKKPAGRALSISQFIRRRNGLGWGLANRLLVRTILVWIVRVRSGST